MLTGVCDNPRWQPKRKTSQCPEWFTWCSGLPASPATSQTWTDLNPYPVPGTEQQNYSCPQSLRSCGATTSPANLLPAAPAAQLQVAWAGDARQEGGGDKWTTATSNLIVRQPKTSCSLGGLPSHSYDSADVLKHGLHSYGIPLHTAETTTSPP